MRKLMLRKVLSVALILFIFFAGTGFGPPAIIESSDGLTPLYQYQLDLVQKERNAPNVIAPAVAIIDGASGKALYTRNAHQRLAPASVTKIMTAILAIENGHLGDYVQIKVNGYAMPGSSIMGIYPGEVLTLEDLLYGLLLPSGNDAALAIAQHVGGSVERFVQMMNEKAAKLGLADTHFVNPHGLDEDGHYSSAYDLAMLGRYAMNNPTFAKIVGTKTYVARGRTTYTLVNGNRLLGQYEGVDGVKTGFTDNAGQSYVASVTRNGHRVFVGLIKSTDRYTDARRLFDYAFANFVWMDLALPSSPFYSISGKDGVKRELKVAVDRAEPFGRWETPYLRSFVQFDDDVLQKEAGDAKAKENVGSAKFYLGSSILGELPVKLN